MSDATTCVDRSCVFEMEHGEPKRGLSTVISRGFHPWDVWSVVLSDNRWALPGREVSRFDTLSGICYLVYHTLLYPLQLIFFHPSRGGEGIPITALRSVAFELPVLLVVSQLPSYNTLVAATEIVNTHEGSSTIVSCCTLNCCTAVHTCELLLLLKLVYWR